EAAAALTLLAIRHKTVTRFHERRCVVSSSIDGGPSMHLRNSLALLLLLSAIPASAKDVYLSIGGRVGVFRTDARIINPSFDKDITITARYLPVGNVNNSAIGTKTITVNRRSMAVYDDVVQSLFGGGPALGAVRLTSDDDFIATQ